MSSLLAIRGSHIGLRFSLGERTRVGRAPDNEIQLIDDSISRCHCEIVRRGRSYTLRDLESLNGVVVNGKAVREKLLLRNDRIDLGDSSFLFDSDYDLRQTRFSNKMVYLSPPQDETLEVSRVVDAAPADAQIAIRGLESLTGLFALGEEDLPTALQQALDSVMQMFKAECGCLLLWDEVSGELQPVVATAPEEQLAVNRQLLQTVFHEKHSILTSSNNIDFKYYQGRAKSPSEALSLLCVPLTFQENAIGVLHLERLRLEEFSLEDMRQLQAVANLLAAAIARIQRTRKQVAPREEEHLEGRSAAWRKVLDQIDRMAPHQAAVLIIGETGTGKEVVARALHERSTRAKYPFVALNCAAIPESLFESELFGYEKGAFTGAQKMTIGKIESAHGGTLFLDEIGELSAAMQPKLLRFLQEKAFYRVGGTKPLAVDVRVLAATNVNLKRAVAEGRFREDLYYRLNVISIEIPPLRQRREDILCLAEYFARLFASQHRREFLGFSNSAIRVMENYAWPGNVRELQNAIERAVLLSSGGVLGEEWFLLPKLEVAEDACEPDQAALTLSEAEAKAIRNALRICKGNQVKAAEMLKIHRNTLRNKVNELGIDVAEYT